MKAILAIVLFLMSLKGFTQSADTYFHAASNLYIHGKMKEAKETVLNGLQKFPDDPELKSLKEKIKEDPPQEDQSKQNKEEQKENQNQQQKQQQQKNKQDQNKEEKNQQQQLNNQQQAEKNEEKKAEPRQAQISKADAEKLLDALKNEEQKVQLKLQKHKGEATSGKVEKDW